jgi:hypothetical protein
MRLPRMSTRQWMALALLAGSCTASWSAAGPSFVVLQLEMALVVALFFSLVGSWTWRRAVLSLLGLAAVFIGTGWLNPRLPALSGWAVDMLPRRPVTQLPAGGSTPKRRTLSVGSPTRTI